MTVKASSCEGSTGAGGSTLKVVHSYSCQVWRLTWLSQAGWGLVSWCLSMLSILMVPLRSHRLCSLSLVIFFLFLRFNNLNHCTFNCSFFFLSNMLLTKTITLVHHIIHSSEIFSLVIVVFSPRISFWFLVNVFYLLTFPFCSYILFLVLSILPLALWAFYRQLFWSLCLVIPPYGLSQGHFLLINFFL